jgi:fibronectin type 3 domain-containing protein
MRMTVLVSANYVEGSTIAPGTGYTQRLLGACAVIVEDRIVSSTGSYGASATQSGWGWWAMQTVAFKAAASGADAQAPTAPTNFSAAASGNQINLSWLASNDDVGVAGYRLERCQGVGCSNFTQSATPSGTRFNDAGLNASTSYSYRVRAVDGVPNFSGYSNTVSARTESAAASIAHVQASESCDGELYQAVNTTLNSAQRAGDLIVVAVGWSDPTAVVTSISDSSENTYTLAVGPTLASFAGRQSIYYAKNIAGASAGINTVTVAFSSTVPWPDLRVLEYSGIDPANPLDAVVATIGTGTTTTSAPVTTTNASDLLVAANYVESSTTGPGAGYTQRLLGGCADIAEDRIVSATGSYTASASLNDTGGWVMQVAAFKGLGSSTGSGDAQAPTAPTNVSANAVSVSQVDLSWTASTDNVGVTAYQVERCQGAGCTNFAQIAAPTAAAFSDAGLVASTTYRYRVRAIDAASNLSAYSAIVTATTLTVLDTQPPSTPTGLTATVVSSSQINLSWNASTDNVGVVGYRVERCQGVGCSSFAQVGAPVGTTFTDTTVVAPNSYTYRVLAVDAVPNLSGYSSTATASTSGAPVGRAGSVTYQYDAFGRLKQVTVAPQ